MSTQLLPPEQLACYPEWLKVEVALRLVRTHLWSPEAWAEVRQFVPWLHAEPTRFRREGVFN